MKKSANGNMYEQTLDETWESFGAHLSGARSALVCVISTQELADPARSALESSAEAFGYGHEGCTFAVIETETGKLDTQSLFLLVEGLDPRCTIVVDDGAARALGVAYRCEVPPEALSRVFGRTVVAFRSFSAMLADDQEKQKAWALLKKLPKLGKR